ncbi:hypothetical protein HLB23_17085 [Nocardia uniformis]|uniref:Uncharacterized protein n=1 Tax=Nocardia uniformis TaxID=53432 RepID=A0A849C563_9NOCA|nr:hypothetical protein [Nocardia uniformis]NNH71560.1 hypothetical protein [Nocardia uniformis]
MTPDRPAGAGVWHQGSPWWDAKSVLVTRPIAPGRIATTPHLVIPAEHGRLNFLLSSYGVEAEQLAHDPRVVIQPGDWRGRPALNTRQQYGTVYIVRDARLAARVYEAMRIKYGARTALARMAHRFTHGSVPYGDLVAFVDVHPNPPRMLTR